MRNTEEFSNKVNDEESDPINISEIFSKYFYHWPLFLLGILICFIGAFIYLRYSQPLYLVSSTLLIKDEKKGGMAGGGDLLGDLNIFNSSKVVDNEIEILKSKTLMKSVVDRLQLSISYKGEGRVKSVDLYAIKPVFIDILKPNKNIYGTSLTLSFPNINTYQLKDELSGEMIKGPLNELQTNKYGTYKVNRSPNFKAFYTSPILITFNDPAVVANQLIGQLSVGLASKQSSVLLLSLQTDVPLRGRDIINTLIQVYNEAALSDKNITTANTIDFIDERLKLITGELTEVEKDVEGFKSSRGLTDLGSDANIFLENVQLNDSKLNEVNLQLSVIKDIQQYINSSSSGEKLPSTLGIEDPVLLGQITQLGQLQLERDQLLTTTTERNPVVAPLIKKIETTRASIKSSINNIYMVLQASKADLQRNNKQFQGSIRKIPGQERQLISIKRQQSIKESLYLYLLQKKEEAALSYASAVADSRTVDPAYVSNAPIKPKPQMVYLIAVTLGIGLPAVYIYIKSLLSTKLKNILELKNITSAPILGEIIHDNSSEGIVVLANSRSAIAEAFRSIRTNIQYLHSRLDAGKGRVTLITSSMSGEGKSFVATNLALALAVSGRKTVLLELDLRKPKISKYLKLENKLGISNYLAGQVEVSDLVIKSEINKNLFIISSGPIPPNPSELLAQKDFEVLIQQLKDNYDDIIIDTPPIGLVTDAQIMSRVAQATIYIVRQGVTYKEQIKRFEQLYKSEKFPRLNVILNDVESNGGYKYGYGYGYYDDDSHSRKVTLKSTWKNLLKRL